MKGYDQQLTVFCLMLNEKPIYSLECGRAEFEDDSPFMFDLAYAVKCHFDSEMKVDWEKVKKDLMDKIQESLINFDYHFSERKKPHRAIHLAEQIERSSQALKFICKNMDHLTVKKHPCWFKDCD